jgi:hypothetical protein
MTSQLAPLWDDPLAAGDGARSYLVLPNLQQPRLVLPTRPRRAASTVIRALRDRSTWKARIRTDALLAAASAGFRSVPLSEPTLVPVLLAHLPPGGYAFGVHFGPARANRKPVIAIARNDGTLAAFAKWGVNPLTDRLVRHEAEALGALDGIEGLDVPTLLGVGEHEGHPYVLQSPVSSGAPYRQDAAAVAAAQVAVAAHESENVDVGRHLASVATRWQQRVDEPGAAPSAYAFAALADAWVTDARVSELRFGSWHGDWRRTNMAISQGRCAVWDWERFATGVPIGYDALHLFLTDRAPTVSDLSALPRLVLRHSQRLLEPFGVTTRETAELVTTGYLLELAGRYLDDRQSTSGARLGAVDQWLLPFLTQGAQ